MKSSDKQKEWKRTHYQRNKQSYADRQRKVRDEVKQFIVDLKSTLKCCRCDENHPACLDFHHEDESKKEFGIADAVTNKVSKTRILKEIQKCIVLCANCHRKEHSKSPLV